MHAEQERDILRSPAGVLQPRTERQVQHHQARRVLEILGRHLQERDGDRACHPSLFAVVPLWLLRCASWQSRSQSPSALAGDGQAMQLVKRGPLSVAMDASWLQVYTSGVWNPPDGTQGCA